MEYFNINLPPLMSNEKVRKNVIEEVEEEVQEIPFVIAVFSLHASCTRQCWNIDMVVSIDVVCVCVLKCIWIQHDECLANNNLLVLNTRTQFVITFLAVIACK